MHGTTCATAPQRRQTQARVTSASEGAGPFALGDRHKFGANEAATRCERGSGDPQAARMSHLAGTHTQLHAHHGSAHTRHARPLHRRRRACLCAAAARRFLLQQVREEQHQPATPWRSRCRARRRRREQDRRTRPCAQAPSYHIATERLGSGTHATRVAQAVSCARTTDPCSVHCGVGSRPLQ